MNKIFLGIMLVVMVSFITGCSSTTILYQCQDGSFKDSADACSSALCSSSLDCPELDCSVCPPKVETKTVEKEVVKYQCYDDSTADKLSDCPTMAERLSAEPIILEGESDQVTDEFYLKKGLAIFRNTYHGESNFMADLIDSEGNFVDLVANTIGNSETSSSVKVPADGYYRVEVTAWPGSNWEIVVEQ